MTDDKREVSPTETGRTTRDQISVGDGGQSSDAGTTTGNARQTQQLTRGEFKRRLLSLPPEHFEHFVAQLWKRLGKETVRVTQASNDKGVDVVVEDGPEREIIQVKRYSNTLDRADVQSYQFLYDQEGANRVTIVTSSRFTDGAKEWAGKHGMTLYDGDDLFDIIREADLSDFLSEWFVEGDYELVGQRTVLEKLLRAVVTLPVAVVSFARPLWAGILSVILALAVFAGALNAVFGPSTTAAIGALVPDGAAAVVTALALVSLVGFPVGLYKQSAGGKALVFVGIFVAASVVSAVLGEVSDLLYNLGLMAIFVALLLVSAHDVYWCYDYGFTRYFAEMKDGFADLLGDGVSADGNLVHAIDLREYATVAARR